MADESNATAPTSSPAAALSSHPNSHFKHVVFSDVDGTLVHYPKNLPRKEADDDADDDDGELVYLPPSRTGTRGVISARTLRLCHALRHGDGDDDGAAPTEDGAPSSNERRRRIERGGVPLVLVSGMRTTTLFQRLPYLPKADAYVSESGGRIFYPRPAAAPEEGGGDGGPATARGGKGRTDPSGLVARPASCPGIPPADAAPFSLVEDARWRDAIGRPDAAGTDGYDDASPVERRAGRLWEFARALTERGYALDAAGYATACRINRKHQTADLASTFDAFVDECSRREGVPDELGCSTNLGCVDIYPIMSGKRRCAEYLLKRFVRAGDGDGGGRDAREPVSLKTHATCMCDDDNDVEMALACRAAYLPSVTSESIRNLVESQDEGGGYRLVVTEDAENGVVGPSATEAALETIIKELSQS